MNHHHATKIIAHLELIHTAVTNPYIFSGPNPKQPNSLGSSSVPGSEQDGVAGEARRPSDSPKYLRSPAMRGQGGGNFHLQEEQGHREPLGRPRGTGQDAGADGGRGGEGG